MNHGTLAAGLGVSVTEVSRLSGGAGRCTMWKLRAGGRQLVYRVYPEGFERNVVREREWQTLLLAHAHGVPVPEPVALTDEGYVMTLVEGEASPRRLLHDAGWAHARAHLVEGVATAAARLHAIDPPDFLPAGIVLDGDEPPPGAATEVALQAIERCLDRVGEAHPAIELGLRVLRRAPPAPAPRVIVHGDLRLSNIVVTAQGEPHLIDWELEHIGDGAEDLGWMCVRSWRFGGPGPALGCGTREQLLAAYRDAGGRSVTADELRWWEMCGNARWAAICLLQSHRHRTGDDRSIARAMTGRRVCEAEWDLLDLVADGSPAPPSAEDVPQDLPDAHDLLTAVADLLRGPLRERTGDATDRFELAVAANACRVVARELPAPDPSRRTAARTLATELRSGVHDQNLDALLDPLRAIVRAKLEVANPRWIG